MLSRNTPFLHRRYVTASYGVKEKQKQVLLSIPDSLRNALILNTFAGLVFILGRSRNSFASGGVLATNMTKRSASVPTNTTGSPLSASFRVVDTNVSASVVACSTVIPAWSRMDDIAVIRRDLLVPLLRVVVICMHTASISGCCSGWLWLKGDHDNHQRRRLQ